MILFTLGNLNTYWILLNFNGKCGIGLNLVNLTFVFLMDLVLYYDFVKDISLAICQDAGL